MRQLLALALIVVSGCAHKMADLKKPERVQRFSLAKDYTRTEVRGLGYKWVEGLRAGEYTLVAEDEEGLYFMGKGRCVVKLVDKLADEYLATGNVKVSASQTVGGSRGFFTGGLWLPKKGVEATPRLFYELDTSDPSAQSQGALVGAIIASGKGDVLFIHYESEKAFLASLKIADK
jgi:hypothetical protein